MSNFSTGQPMSYDDEHSCDTCRYEDRDSHEQPRISCSRNYLNKWDVRYKDAGKATVPATAPPRHPCSPSDHAPLVRMRYLMKPLNRAAIAHSTMTMING